MAAKAGVNLNCGYIYQYLPQAIEKGLIRESILDSILAPLLKTRFKLGLFDPPALVPWSDLGEEVVNCPEHKALAYEAAAKSIVLLQNKNNILPLNRDSIKSIFVTGPVAADILALTGNYNGWSGDMVTFLEGILRSAGAGTKVDYSLGCQLNTPGGYTGFWEAQMADAIVVCLGNTRMLEGEEGDAMLNPDGGDRTDIRLPESQREFIRLLREKAPGKPIIAIITGGSAIALQEVMEAADAVLFAWYPGEQGGMALADIIFGKVNPSGKLPVTFYKSIDDLPAFDDYSMKGRTYKCFEGEPLFPFGYGLSYTRFEVLDLKVEEDILLEREKLHLEITVTNTGVNYGEEVITIFATQITGEEPPERHLVGFRRVFLNAGETKTITIKIDLFDMYQWDTENKRYFTRTGEYLLSTDPYGSFDKFVKFSVR
jgi:beta-glucosidase